MISPRTIAIFMASWTFASSAIFFAGPWMVVIVGPMAMVAATLAARLDIAEGRWS